MEKEGKNPFMDYQIPESVIKFKPRNWKTYKSKDDKGVITILDARLYKKIWKDIYRSHSYKKNINYLTRKEILKE